MGNKLKEAVTDACSQLGEHLQVAVITRKLTEPLAQTELDNSRQSTTALRTRLQALMQSTRSVRNHSGYMGALNIHKLHTLAAGNAKVFLRKGERVGVNTAVHILIDSSGSMNAKEMQLASQACFAVASALSGIKGISVGVTTFPGERGVYEGTQREHWLVYSFIKISYDNAVNSNSKRSIEKALEDIVKKLLDKHYTQMRAERTPAKLKNAVQ